MAKFRITVHAVDRYAERILGERPPTCQGRYEEIKAMFPIEELRTACKLKAKLFRKDGIVFVFRGGVVVTVATEEMYTQEATSRHCAKKKPPRRRRANRKRFKTGTEMHR